MIADFLLFVAGDLDKIEAPRIRPGLDREQYLSDQIQTLRRSSKTRLRTCCR